MYKNLFFLLTVILLSGCTSMMAKPDFTPFKNVEYVSKSPDDTIEIFAIPPKREYIELGLISCRDTDSKWNLNQAILKARQIGADAIIITKKDHLTSTTPVVGTPFHYGIEAVAIKYK